MPHYTTNYGGSKRDPWLISLVMWSKCLRFVPPEGVRAVELESLARTKTNLYGMRRWGYVTVTKESLICLTPAGQKADQIWREIFPIMDKRWQARFGQGTIEQLHKTLQALINQMDLDHLPDCYRSLATDCLANRQPKNQSRDNRMTSVYRRFYRGFCWLSRLRSNAIHPARSPSPPMSCEFLLKTECAFEICQC